MKRREEITKKALELDTTNDIATFVVAAQWADATMIDRACEWLKCEMSNYISFDGEIDEEFITDFRKAMKD